MSTIEEVLLACLHPDPNIRKNAEQFLTQSENQHIENYLESLIQVIFKEGELSSFAAVLLKGTLKNNWLKVNRISEEKKQNIRQFLVEKLPSLNNEQIINILAQSLAEICILEVTKGSEYQNHIGYNNANIPYSCLTFNQIILVLEKVADEGEDANKFSGLLSEVSGTNNFVLTILQYARRLLLPLHLSIKFLLENHKDLFLKEIPFETIQKLIESVSEKWNFAMVILSDILEDDEISYENEKEALEEQELITRLSEVCSISMRLLRRIIKIGFTFSNQQNNSTKEISSELHNALKQFAELQSALFEGRNNKRALINNRKMGKIIEKELINATKTIKELISNFPTSMIPYLQEILKFYLPILMSTPKVNEIQSASFEEKFLVFTIHCFTNSFEKSRDIHEIRKILENTFENIENMKNLLFIILTKLLPIHKDEINLCNSDPQEFVQQQLSESYDFDIKSSAKFLWLAMNRNFSDLPPISLDLISSFLSSPLDKNNKEEFILCREACYHGLSLCYNEFHRLLGSFSSFFNSMILPDSKCNENEYKFIKQQICNMLIDGWASELDNQSLIPCLQMLISFLRDDDYLISVWGSIAFRNVCNGFILKNLDTQTFKEFTNEAINAMLPLSLKLQNDFIATIIVDNIGRLSILKYQQLNEPVGIHIIQSLFTLYQHSTNSSNLRNSILRCLSLLIHTTCLDSNNNLLSIENDLVKLILLSTDVGGYDSEMIYTSEGVYLWKVLLERFEEKDSFWLTQRYSNDLLNRFEVLLKLTDQLSHLNVPAFIAILQYHILILSPDFLKSRIQLIITFLGNILIAKKKSWKVS